MPASAKWPTVAFISALILFGVLFFKLGESFFVTNDRSLATDSRGADLSGLEGADFMINARLKMIEGLAIHVRDGHTWLTTTHFLGPRTPISICSTYPNIEYEFVADDQASSGEPVLLNLSMACEARHNGDSLEELEVPSEKILDNKPRDTEFQVYGKHNVTVKVTNIGDEWPKSWSMRSVRLYNSASEIRVERAEIFRLRGKPLQMQW